METLYSIKIYFVYLGKKRTKEYKHKTKKEIEQIKSEFEFWILKTNRDGCLFKITKET